MRRPHGGWTNIVDAWFQAMQRMIAANPVGIIGPADVNRAVDAWFDLAASLLAANREYAKTMVRAATAIPATWSKPAE